jgi:hypothetical protein
MGRRGRFGGIAMHAILHKRTHQVPESKGFSILAGHIRSHREHRERVLPPLSSVRHAGRKTQSDRRAGHLLSLSERRDLRMREIAETNPLRRWRLDETNPLYGRNCCISSIWCPAAEAHATHSHPSVTVLASKPSREPRRPPSQIRFDSTGVPPQRLRALAQREKGSWMTEIAKTNPLRASRSNGPEARRRTSNRIDR